MYKPLTSFYANAHIQWICENNLTPYIAVNCNVKDVIVPEHLIRDGRIIFNVSSSAVINFKLNSKVMSFTARFSGVPHSIYCPIESLEVIYAQEDPVETSFPIGDMTFNDKEETYEEVTPINIKGSDKGKPVINTNSLEVVSFNPEIKPTKSRAYLKIIKT